MISASQIKAARVLLKWSQGTLAKNAGVSAGTIKGAEAGFMPKDSILHKMHNAIDKAGVELLDNDGVRRRAEGVHVFRGPDGGERFFENVKNTISDYDDEILVLMASNDIWLQPYGSANQNNLQKLIDLSSKKGIKCLVSNKIILPPQPAAVQFQYLASESVEFLASSCNLIYGNKCATLHTGGGRSDFIIVELCIPLMAITSRENYLSLWNRLHR